MLYRSSYFELCHAYKIWFSNIFHYCTDHSYFEKVIEQLQQVSGAEKESRGDVDLTHEEEELTPGNNVCFLFFNFSNV